MFKNHVRVTENVRVCQKRSHGGAGGPTTNTPNKCIHLDTIPALDAQMDRNAKMIIARYMP